MRPGAARNKVRNNGGWAVAFALAVCATILSAAVLVGVVLRGPDDGPGPASAQPESAATGATAERNNASTHSPSPAPTPTPVPRATLVPNAASRLPGPATPVLPPGRSFALTEDAALRVAVEAALGDEKDDFSVAVFRSSDGKAVLFDADREFYAASLFKLAVLYEAGVRLSSGELGLEDRLYLAEAEIAEDLGTLQYVELDEEGSLTVQDALEAMVTLSDNAIAVAFLHVLGGASIDARLRGIGVETTSVNTTDLPTTAREMARLMDAIVAGEGLEASVRELLLGMLARQRTRDGIPSGLPDGVQSGNKTGTWDAITHDVAWVEAPSGTYVIAVLSQSDRGWDTVARVSDAVYATLEGR